jgi:copper ion binding protein
MFNKIKSMQSRTKLLLSIAVVLILTSFASLALTYSGNNAKTETVKLNSLVCDQCVDTLNKVIGSIDGVSNVDISLTEKQAIVTFDDSKTSLDKIETAITSAGYSANDKLADKDAFEKLPACCKIKENSGCKGMDNMNMNMNDSKNKNMNMEGCSKDKGGCTKGSKCTGK